MLTRVEMTHVGWLVFTAVLGLVGVLLVWRRARIRRAIEELDGFALLTEARWEGEALVCRIAGGAQLRLDVTTLASIDWREYGDGVNGSARVMSFAFTFAGVVPPVAVIGSSEASAGQSDPPISTVMKGLKQRNLIGGTPNTLYNAFSPVTNEAQHRVSAG